MSESPPHPHADLWDEVNDWLEANWNPDLTVDAWWKTVAAAGWTAPHFTPEQGGRGLTPRSQVVVRKCFVEFGALRPPGGLGLLMAAPTILVHGTPDQVARHVTPILEGRLGWCQLFSEPSAGSDLAGLTTRATRDGDRWIITGQKVWSSQAMHCDYGMLLARTDFDVPKHKGISWFAFKLDQPGVTIRPLREMTGDAVFNEIFIDEAVVDDADLIGGAGNGWTVTQTTLHFERTGIGAGGGVAGFPFPGPNGGMLGRRAGDAALEQPANAKVTLGFDDVAALAKRSGRSDDPVAAPGPGPALHGHDDRTLERERAKAEAKRGGGQAIANIGKLTQPASSSWPRLGVAIIGATGLWPGATDPRTACSPSCHGLLARRRFTGAATRSSAHRRRAVPRASTRAPAGKDLPYDEVLRARRSDYA